MTLAEWIGLEEALALRGASLIRALRGADIFAEGRPPRRSDNPAYWIVMASAIWQDDAIFRGEPGFPLLNGRFVEGIVCVFRSCQWAEVRLRRVDVEALPKPPGVIHQAVLTWLLRRAKQAGRLKQRREFPDCKVATGCTWLEYLAVFRDLPDKYQYRRGRPR